MQMIYITIVLAPLMGSLIAGLFGNQIGRSGAHIVTIAGVSLSFFLALFTLKQLLTGAEPIFNQTIYTWMVTDGLKFEIGFLVDNLTAIMMVVVTGVSLMVHIYTIGYMAEDNGYQRFFSYISLFTFSMLMLVMSNNFLQLFFGWEAVGLVSYLLIGFWFKRDTAIYANLKAFLVNRVGDFGFLLGIALIVLFAGSLNYTEVFEYFTNSNVEGNTFPLMGMDIAVVTLASILLFIGAMGKSAQMPLHVWLPDSMEGPTPISALIHAATMVTAGIFMVARMSPLFELSETALIFILFVGAATAFLMGLIGMVERDIKRVVAYSTLSQLGYMTVALGVSAYSAAIFHLMTHAFFKALLFLAAGSVIMGMHHQQDMHKMGGLRKYMPITYITALVGALALIGTPGFAGFFSKDVIIEAVGASHLYGADVIYYILLAGVFVTAFYTFRMIFLVFHGKERMDEHTKEHLHESPWVVTLPLVLLAIPSIIIGYCAIEPLLFGHFFDDAIFVTKEHDVLHHIGSHFHGAWQFMLHGFQTPAFYLAASGVLAAWFLYIHKPELPTKISEKLNFISAILRNKYGFDKFNDWFFAGGARALGGLFSRIGDRLMIDGLLVNGSAKVIAWLSSLLRHIQTGLLYHYAFAMILGLLALLTWFLFR